MKTGMKIVILILLLVSCMGRGDQRLNGDWEVVEFTIIDGYNNAKSNENTLRNTGAIWDLHFSGNGDFQQDFNMSSQDKTMQIQKGTWTTVDDSLKIVLYIDTLTSRLNYHYQLDNNILTLNLQHPLLKSRAVTKFRKK